MFIETTSIKSWSIKRCFSLGDTVTPSLESLGHFLGKLLQFYGPDKVALHFSSTFIVHCYRPFPSLIMLLFLFVAPTSN